MIIRTLTDYCRHIKCKHNKSRSTLYLNCEKIGPDWQGFDNIETYTLDKACESFKLDIKNSNK